MTTSNEKATRKRAATDPIERVNNKSDQQFIEEHLSPRYDLNFPLETHNSHPSYPFVSYPTLFKCPAY